jgi:hypothetical protein
VYDWLRPSRPMNHYAPHLPYTDSALPATASALPATASALPATASAPRPPFKHVYSG